MNSSAPANNISTNAKDHGLNSMAQSSPPNARKEIRRKESKHYSSPSPVLITPPTTEEVEFVEPDRRDLMMSALFSPFCVLISLTEKYSEGEDLNSNEDTIRSEFCTTRNFLGE